jgi:hypothetical protein
LADTGDGAMNMTAARVLDDSKPSAANRRAAAPPGDRCLPR